eukprot:1077354-Pelagomonas_calceolata.AAC.2
MAEASQFKLLIQQHADEERQCSFALISVEVPRAVATASKEYGITSCTPPQAGAVQLPCCYTAAGSLGNCGIKAGITNKFKRCRMNSFMYGIPALSRERSYNLLHAIPYQTEERGSGLNTPHERGPFHGQNIIEVMSMVRIVYYEVQGAVKHA